eukprot:325734-Amphidinium_carterae.2
MSHADAQRRKQITSRIHVTPTVPPSLHQLWRSHQTFQGKRLFNSFLLMNLRPRRAVSALSQAKAEPMNNQEILATTGMPGNLRTMWLDSMSEEYDQFARLTALSTASEELLKWARSCRFNAEWCSQFTRKPLSSAQRKEAIHLGKNYAVLAYKPKSRIVVCGYSSSQPLCSQQTDSPRDCRELHSEAPDHP